MSEMFSSSLVRDAFKNLCHAAERGLRLLNQFDFEEAEAVLKKSEQDLPSLENYDVDRDVEIRNEIFVLKLYSDLFLDYLFTWKNIYSGKFSESWPCLQNALDTLRLIKKFSSIETVYFENQLTELEKTYPYKVFMSIGCTVEKIECQICRNDIDGADCVHMRGELYSGRVCRGVIKNMVLREVSMVPFPEDKRCVVSYSDDGEQFKLVRFLANMLISKKMRISDFSHLQFSKKMKPNPVHLNLGRNEPCYCGSGKKFKKCCITNELVEGDHVDIIGGRYDVQSAFS